VRLGALVTGKTHRNPAMLTKIVTTPDVVSGERAFLGVGAGWLRVRVVEAFDTVGDRDATRRRRTHYAAGGEGAVPQVRRTPKAQQCRELGLGRERHGALVLDRHLPSPV
jgi:hypothetical protein